MSQFSFLDKIVIGLTFVAIIFGLLLIVTNIKSIKDAKRMEKLNENSPKKSNRKYSKTALTVNH
jgi:hypothetical protein